MKEKKSLTSLIFAGALLASLPGLLFVLLLLKGKGPGVGVLAHLPTVCFVFLWIIAILFAAKKGGKGFALFGLVSWAAYWMFYGTQTVGNLFFTNKSALWFTYLLHAPATNLVAARILDVGIPLAFLAAFGWLSWSFRKAKLT